MKRLQIDPSHLEMVVQLLKKYNVKAYAFGSRTKNTAKPLSDLDLCIKQKCEKSVVRKLMDDFEDSNLPFKVDLIIWSEISENFQKKIERDLLEIDLT